MDTGIYAIENIMNHRVYVGATKLGLTKRWRVHLAMLHHRTHAHDALRLDAEKYGPCVFRCILLQGLPPTVAMAPFEQFWIDYLRRLGVDCYNKAKALDVRYPRHRVLTPPPEYDLTLSEAYDYLRDRYRIDIGQGRMSRDIAVGSLRGFFDGNRWYVRSQDMSRYLQRRHRQWRPIRLVDGVLTTQEEP